MLQINFYPESDKREDIKAAEEYQDIWDKEGVKIVTAIEKYSNLTFKIKIIKALVFEGASSSNPLKLRNSYSFDIKRSTLIHELIHILLRDNNIKIPGKINFKEDLHKVIYLILYDVWVDLFGKNLAMVSKDKECVINLVYKKAWSWALSFPKEERMVKFQEMKKKYQKNI